MKQLDYENSNYKYKEDIKNFVNAINELADKYVKSFENADADLKKVNASIDKKHNSIDKLDATLLDLGNKVDELLALKDLSNEEIKALNEKKSSISYTDSEVQKMELDDINSQITAKKGKISKIDVKIDATKAKIKTDNEEKKNGEKELRELEKNRRVEEEALFRTHSLIDLIKDLKEQMNTKSLSIVNDPYKPQVEEKPVSPLVESDTQKIVEVPQIEEPQVSELNVIDEDILNADYEIIEANIPVIDEKELDEMDYNQEEVEEPKSTLEVQEERVVLEEKKNVDNFDEVLKKKFASEGVDVAKFTDEARNKMMSNKDTVIKNMDILKKHGVPLTYTEDQPEIYYDIVPQDLDDLLSIITTDEDGNGMGFTIDFTYNILSELSHINVDKLIDVYNEEFMNVNAKSGIIPLLKLTNPELKDFAKNRRVNISILRDLGADTVDEVIARHPEFVDMDNPLFVSVLNVFDRNDLVEKLNADVDVVTKIIEYWKEN